MELTFENLYLAQLESIRKIQQRLQLQGQRRLSQTRGGGGGEGGQEQVSAAADHAAEVQQQQAQGISMKIYTCFETRVLKEKIARLEGSVTLLALQLAASAQQLAAVYL